MWTWILFSNFPELKRVRRFYDIPVGSWYFPRSFKSSYILVPSKSPLMLLFSFIKLYYDYKVFCFITHDIWHTHLQRVGQRNGCVKMPECLKYMRKNLETFFVEFNKENSIYWNTEFWSIKVTCNVYCIYYQLFYYAFIMTFSVLASWLNKNGNK